MPPRRAAASLGVVHGLDELDRRSELHPPVQLLARQALLVETADVLNGREQVRDVRLDEDVDENRHEVVRRRDGLLVRHAQEVHDRRGASQDALQLVLWCLPFTITSPFPNILSHNLQ